MSPAATTSPEPEFFPLTDTDHFDRFWEDNCEAISVDKKTAFLLACNCALIIGGGAAPLFRVGFVDEEM
jgi:hypothetical protein